MGTSLSVASTRAIESARPVGRLTDHLAGDVLSEIARTLWPTKTAEHVASCASCTVRAAERYLAGDREWSSDALAAIVAEILKRHSMRNVRVVSRDGGH
jgi:hypothetical protein